MRKLFPLVIMLALTVLISSCSKDKDESPSSSFTYDGKSYTMSKGFITENWDEAGVYEKRVTLSPKDYVNTYTSKTSYVALHMRTSSADLSIPDGVYTFSESMESSTFGFAAVAVEWDEMAEVGHLNEDVSGGKITVSNGGKKMEFQLTFLDGKTATGTFNGTLVPFE